MSKYHIANLYLPLPSEERYFYLSANDHGDYFDVRGQSLHE